MFHPLGFMFLLPIKYQNIKKKNNECPIREDQIANPDSSSPTQALQEGPICPYQAQTRLSPPIKHKEVEILCFAM